jgi:hypothetical protein
MNAQMFFKSSFAQADSSAAENYARSMSIFSRSLAMLGFVAAGLIAAPAMAQNIPLGTAAGFSVLAGSAVTNTGPSVITGDFGIWPDSASSVTGFTFSTTPGPGQVIGTTHLGDAVASQAQSDLTAAYNTAAGLPCGTVVAADLGGTTVTPGVHCAASSMGITGTVTLDAQGDSNATFVFQIGSTLTTGSNAAVRLINGGQSCNVYWQIGSSATLGTGTSFAGTILAFSSITLNTGASSNGRALARNAAVTMDTNSVSLCSLVVAPPVLPPTLAKAFNPVTINAGGVSTLTITLSNPNAASSTLTSPLVDTLPNGVVIAAAPNVSTTCNGVGGPVAVVGGSSVTLPAGRSIPANGNCTVSVDVTAALPGSYINTLVAGALMTSSGNNTSPAVATLTVVAPLIPPTLGKAFNPATINAGGVSTLTVTLSNPNAAIATLTSPLVDTLPGGVVIASSPNAGTTCGGVGVPLAVVGGGTVSLPAGRSIPANGSCTLSVDVSAALAGSYLNTLPAGTLVTSNGNNPAPAIATLTVIAIVGPSAPPLSKAFNPATINAGGISTLTITLTNPNAGLATLTAPLTDTLPVGVVIATTPNMVTTCGGAGALTGVAGGSSITLPAGRTIPVNAACTVTLDVTSDTGGNYINTLLAGALVTSNGNSPGPAVATLTVVPLVIVVPPVVPPGAALIPTLSGWAMLLLAALLALFGAAGMRRQAE